MVLRACRFAALLAAVVGGWESGAQAAPVPLVVVVVIDQFRGDYLDAFGTHFSEGGFKRVMRDGAWFSNAHLEYGTTATGPGHATMLTGVSPAVHGIVANDWHEFSSKLHGAYCCGDDTVRSLGLPEGKKADGRSPRNLRSATLGDAIQSAFGPASKVWGVAIKDRSAILSAGLHADGAVWFDDGYFVTSTFYAPALPEWVAQLNRERFAERYFKQPWDRLLPAGLYGPRFLTAPGKDRPATTSEFPKILGGDRESPDKKYYDQLLNSPFGNELVFEAARRAVTAEQLGRDNTPDLLTVGCSSNDIVGHTYGPDSDEVMDCTLRTDRQLEAFLNWLDEHVGRGRYLLAVTADHGVGPMTEETMALGMGGGRLQGGEMKKTLNRALKEQYGSATSEPLVAELSLPWIYLDQQAVTAANLDLDDVARFAARCAATYPGIERSVAMCDVPATIDGHGDDMLDLIRNSYFAGRAGHVYVHWTRYWYKGSQQAGHGSAYDYDQHVPVMLMGPGIRPGRFDQPVRPTGMVATICAVLGIAPPSAACTPPLAAALSATPASAP